MHRGQNPKMMKIKEEVMDPEPHPSENGAYQIYFLKVEDTEEDTPPGDVIKTESSVDNAGSLILQSGCEGTSFYRHMLQDDGGNEKRFIKREPDVGTPSLQNSLKGTSPSLQMIGGDEERNEVRATCIQREADDVTTEENLMVVSNTKLWTIAEPAARVCVTDHLTTNCGSNPGGNSQQSHGAGKHCQDRLGSSRFHQGKTNKQKETLARGCKGEKQHCCLTCNKSFTRKDNLTRHTRTHFRGKPNQPPHYNKGFSKKKTIDHNKTHLQEKFHQCSDCKKNFSQEHHLREHLQNQSKEKLHQCQDCDRRFAEERQLLEHQQCHSKEKPHPCSQCNKSFCSKHYLLEHQRSHSGEKYTCSVCKMTFSQKKNLRRHTRVHTGVKPYGCSLCDMKFSHHYGLTQHMSSHTGEKPYICNLCGKKFSRKIRLRDHLRWAHNGEKQKNHACVCSVCNTNFSTQSSLRVHMRIHSGEKPFCCPVCRKRFRQSYSLRIHMRIHSGEKPYECEKCKMAFSRSDTLSLHIKTHTDGKAPTHSDIPRKKSKKRNISEQKISHSTVDNTSFQCICDEEMVAEFLKTSKETKISQCSVVLRDVFKNMLKGRINK